MRKNNQKGINKCNWTDNQYLMDYLNGGLSATERQLLEFEMQQNPFVKDALEGLANLSAEKDVAASVQLLQKKLQTQIHSRKKRHHRYLRPKLSLWLTALVLLLLILMAWWLLTLAKVQ